MVLAQNVMKKRTFLWLGLTVLAFTLYAVVTYWYYKVYWPPIYERARSEGLRVDPTPLPANLAGLLFWLVIFCWWVKRRRK